jgi:hypothetical protein
MASERDGRHSRGPDEAPPTPHAVKDAELYRYKGFIYVTAAAGGSTSNS